MESFVDKELTFIFKCTCGSVSFERPDALKTHNLTSFYEGYFVCCSCKEEHDYTSEAFEKSYTQLTLF